MDGRDGFIIGIPRGEPRCFSERANTLTNERDGPALHLLHH